MKATNNYGYPAHFDLQDANGQFYPGGLGWDNVEVTYEQVSCSQGSFGNWSQSCQCASNSSTDYVSETDSIDNDAFTF